MPEPLSTSDLAQHRLAARAPLRRSAARAAAGVLLVVGGLAAGYGLARVPWTPPRPAAAEGRGAPPAPDAGLPGASADPSLAPTS